MRSLAASWAAWFAVVAAVIMGFGRAISEVGLAIMVGGNIKGFTRVITTAISLETSKGELELVGFGVGVVERDRVVDGSAIRVGDVLIGVASSGLHSNGFSLVRSVVDEGLAAERFGLFDEVEELNTSLASALLTPTRIYVKPVLNVMRDFALKGVVHVTGGGFAGNVPRVLPKGVRARIDPSSWRRPPIFAFLQQRGKLSDDEMLRVFNCGIGMILIVAREQEGMPEGAEVEVRLYDDEFEAGGTP